MKKKFFILTMLTGSILLSFSACKSKADKNVPAVEQSSVNTPAPIQEQSAPNASDIINQISIPNFTNAEVTKFCNDFKDLMVEYAQSKGSSDQIKEAELEQKFTNWATQATQLAGKIKPEEMAKFNDFISNAQAKFSEMANATSLK